MKLIFSLETLTILYDNLKVEDEPPDILLSKLSLSWISCCNWTVEHITFGMYKNKINTNFNRDVHKYYPVICDKNLFLNKWDFIEHLKNLKHFPIIENITPNLLNFNNFIFFGGLIATTSLLMILKRFIKDNNDYGLLCIVSQLDDNFYQEGSLTDIKNRLLNSDNFKFKTFTYITPDLSIFLINNNFIKIIEIAEHYNNINFMLPHFLYYVLTNSEMLTTYLVPQFTENGAWNSCKINFISNQDILSNRVILSETITKMMINSKIFGL